VESVGAILMLKLNGSLNLVQRINGDEDAGNWRYTFPQYKQRTTT
jgi:hypothetical protein